MNPIPSPLRLARACALPLALWLLLSGCTNNPAPTATHTRLPPTLTRTASLTPTLTATVPPTSTPTSTAAATPGPAANCTVFNTDGKLILLDKDVLYANGPSSKEIQQALAGTFPEWAAFTQAFERGEKTYVYDIGKVMRTASLAETFSLNPAITLVTLGVSLDWQLPPDGDLYSRAYAIGERLDHLYWEYAFNNDRIQSQYPEVANGATYALYLYFDRDQEVLRIWCETYYALFSQLPFHNP